MLNTIETRKEKVLLKNVRILDVRAGALTAQANVLTRKGMIVDLDARGDAPDCDVIECDGLTLSPGLIDCHCHILSPFIAEQKGIPGAWALRQIHRNFAATLACGVVCVRDMLSPIKIMNHYRRAIDAGHIVGPRILAAGPIFSVRGGYPEFIEPLPGIVAAFTGQPKLHIETPRQATDAIRDLHRQGINLVKVAYTALNVWMEYDKPLPTISPEVFDAICETAHALELKVGVHHFCTDDLTEILRHDVDTIEHLPFDREFTPDELELFKRRGATVVPTLTMTDCAIRYEEKAEFLNSAQASTMFDPYVLEYLKRLAATWLDFSDPEYLKSFGASRGMRSTYYPTFRNATLLHEAGIKFCAGTDMGAVTSFPGETADEVKRLHHIGLSRLDAMRAATLNAAELLGIGDRLGAIEPGMCADVIMIQGNPLEDIDAISRIRMVGKGGRWYKTKYPELPDFWPGFGLIMDSGGDKDS